jgi:hypothetical protein
MSAFFPISHPYHCQWTNGNSTYGIEKRIFAQNWNPRGPWSKSLFTFFLWEIFFFFEKSRMWYPNMVHYQK